MKELLEQFNEFYNTLGKDETLYVVFDMENPLEITKDFLLELLKSSDLQEIILNTDCYLISENEREFKLNKEFYDYLFKYSYRWKNIFENTPKTKTKTTNQYTIEVAVKTKDSIVNNVRFTGTKKECIMFINKQIKYNHIKSFTKDTTVLKLDLDGLNDNEEWETLEELELKGVVTLQ